MPNREAPAAAAPRRSGRGEAVCGARFQPALSLRDRLVPPRGNSCTRLEDGQVGAEKVPQSLRVGRGLRNGLLNLNTSARAPWVVQSQCPAPHKGGAHPAAPRGGLLGRPTPAWWRTRSSFYCSQLCPSVALPPGSGQAASTECLLGDRGLRTGDRAANKADASGRV